MKTRSAAYIVEQASLTPRPIRFVRFYHVKKYGDTTDYPFSVDFSDLNGEVTGSTKTKRRYIRSMSGGPMQVVPEEGRADIGGFSVEFIDGNTEDNREGEFIKYLSAPVLTLAAGIGASTTTITFNQSVAGLPDFGTLEITTADVTERIRYTSKGSNSVSGATRGVDGTLAATHSLGDPATNGEQIRPGTRMQVFLGYEGLPESQYMSFTKVEVIQRNMASDMVAFVVDTADILRTMVKEIFTDASQLNNVALVGTALDLALRIMVSTGTGVNGTYDTLPAAWGLAIPLAFVDVTKFEEFIAEGLNVSMDFLIRGPEDGKSFLENEIFKVLNLYPVINQTGQISLRANRFPEDTPTVTLTEEDIEVIGFSTADRLITNHVIYKNDENHAADPAASGGQWGVISNFRALDSINKYGQRETRTIESRGLRVALGANPVVNARAEEIFARYADPPAVYEVLAHYRNHHLEAGDLVFLTSPFTPNLAAGVRGLVNEKLELTNIEVDWNAGKLRMTFLDVNTATELGTSTPDREDAVLADTLDIDEVLQRVIARALAEGVSLEEQLSPVKNP